LKLTKPHFNYTYNPDYFKIYSDPQNSTHYGATIQEVLIQLDDVSYKFEIETDNRILVQQTINVCKLSSRLNGFYLKMFQLIASSPDTSVPTCPVKKGKYFAVQARPKDFLDSLDLTEKVPGYIPLRGKYFFSYKLLTTVQRRKVEIFRGLEVFEFV
jgi:hypothetical protein